MSTETVQADKDTVVSILEDLENKLQASGKRYELDIDTYQSLGSAHHADRIWEAVVHELNDSGWNAALNGRTLRITSSAT